MFRTIYTAERYWISKKCRRRIKELHAKIAKNITLSNFFCESKIEHANLLAQYFMVQYSMYFLLGALACDFTARIALCKTSFTNLHCKLSVEVKYCAKIINIILRCIIIMIWNVAVEKL